MVPGFDLHEAMTRFRLASRELFNNCLRTGGRDDEAWKAQERFTLVEGPLFDALVALPAGLPCKRYGVPQDGISLVPSYGQSGPWMLNRDTDSGYWDHPQSRFTADARLWFVEFFDGDLLDFIDRRYVRAVVADWPGHPELVGKHALIETIHVRFVRGEGAQPPGGR